MSRPITIANNYHSESLASPIESLGKSIGAQQIVDSICGSPLVPQATRHVPMTQKNDRLQETPEFQFSSYMYQGGRVLGQNSQFVFGTPPPSSCNCTHHSIINATTNNNLLAGTFSGSTAVNNNIRNWESLFSSQNAQLFQVPQSQLLTPLETQILQSHNITFNEQPSMMHQVHQVRLPVQPSASGIFNTMRDNSIADDLLTRYRANPSLMKSLKLSDIRGLLLKFAKDQVGSRFIQQKLEFCDNREKDSIFQEVLDNAPELVDDIFGNYVVQKFFEYGEEKHWIRLVNAIIDRVPQYAFQMYACRVLQKALEKVNEPLQIKILSQIRQVISRCVKDQNGNHVIQKAIEKVRPKYIQFIVDTLLETESTIFEMSVDPYGCRVVQRCLEHCIPAQTRPIIDHIHARFDEVANNQYGNYVVQHVIQHGSELDRMIIVERVATNLLVFATHKYSSNVIEKCLEFGAVFHKGIIVRAACYQPESSVPILVQMMKDQYANYVVQKMFDQVTVEQRRELILAVRPHIPLLRQYPHGKHILAKLEKYFQKPVIMGYAYADLPMPLDH